MNNQVPETIGENLPVRTTSKSIDFYVEILQQNCLNRTSEEATV